ncbi:MAG: T9SS type A sorting domain-containing protein [Prevotellaceae bacterium]|jgi:sorbitol-specific phosphotransferase system component IIA|nr:T9SS type A sorting domain-containing protein [Prevotellaceae bacterium]
MKNIFTNLKFRACLTLTAIFIACGTANAAIPYLTNSGTTTIPIMENGAMTGDANWANQNGSTSNGYFTTNKTTAAGVHHSNYSCWQINNSGSFSVHYFVARIKLRAGKTAIGSNAAFCIERGGWCDNITTISSNYYQISSQTVCDGFFDTSDTWVIITLNWTNNLEWTRGIFVDPDATFMIKDMYFCNSLPDCPSPPSAPSPPIITSVSQSGQQATISWGAVASATSYNVYTAAGDIIQLDVTATSYTTTGTSLAIGEHCYKVSAVNAVGESALSDPSCVTIAPPSPPIITSVSQSGQQAIISWDAVADATSYKVYTAAGVLIQSGVTATSYTTTGTSLAIGEHCYKVSAVNAVGESVLSDPSCVTIVDPSTIDPDADVECSGTNVDNLTQYWTIKSVLRNSYLYDDGNSQGANGCRLLKYGAANADNTNARWILESGTKIKNLSTNYYMASGNDGGGSDTYFGHHSDYSNLNSVNLVNSPGRDYTLTSTGNANNPDEYYIAGSVWGDRRFCAINSGTNYVTGALATGEANGTSDIWRFEIKQFPVTTYPDLVITSASFNASTIFLGNAVTGTVTVQNSGANGAVAAGTALRITLKFNDKFYVINHTSIGIANNSGTEVVPFSFTPVELSGSAKTLWAKVNSQFAIDELNCSNNTYTSTSTCEVICTPPNSPTDVSATLSGSNAVITWEEVSGASYAVWESTNNNDYNWLANVAAGTFTYTAPLVSSGTNYYKVLSAADGCYSALSEAVSVDYITVWAHSKYYTDLDHRLMDNSPKYLGDYFSEGEYNFEFETNQYDGWQTSEVIYGQSNNADEYEEITAFCTNCDNGSRTNSTVKADIGSIQFTETGITYFIGRVRISIEPFVYAYKDWGNSTVFDTAQCYYTEVLPLRAPTSISLSAQDNEKTVSLDFTKWNGKKILVIRKDVTEPEPVVNNGELFGGCDNCVIIFNETPTDETPISIDDNTPEIGATYNYYFYSVNNNYYSTPAVVTIKAGETSISTPTGTENPVVKNITVFPNPASDMLYISGISENDNVILTDLIGKILLSHKGSPLDVSMLPSGVYLLKAGAAPKVVKVVKK